MLIPSWRIRRVPLGGQRVSEERERVGGVREERRGDGERE